LPRPFARAVIVAGTEIVVPPNIDRDEIELYRQKVQTEMDRLESQAEGYLAGNQPDSDATPRRQAA
jgi:hypothetical protein